MRTKEAIREFVKGLLAGHGDREPFTDDESLLTSGRLQSVDTVQMVAFLEEHFGTDFADTGFDRDMFDSVGGICRLAGLDCA